MKRICLSMLLFLCAVATPAEWSVVGEVPILGVPQEIVDRGDGTYLVVFKGFDDVGYFLRGKLVDSTGIVTDSSMIIQPQVSDFRLLIPSDEDYDRMSLPEGVVHLGIDEDTAWVCTLGTVNGYEGSSSLLTPSSSGGCWALFGPVSGSYEWRVWRLSASGEVEAGGAFTLQGGPINSMNDMLECPDGGLMLTGVTDSIGMRLYMVLIRLDEHCGEVWRILDDVRYHASGDLLGMDAEGSVYVAGYTGLERSDGWFMPPERMDVLLYKIAPDGEFQWKSVLHLPGQNAPLLLTLLEDGGAVLLVSSFEENSSFPGRYSLVTCHPD